MIQEAIQAYLESLNKEEKAIIYKRKTFTKSIIIHDIH